MIHKLTYWVSVCLNDSHVYSIRAKTRKEVAARRLELGFERYGLPKKVTVEYSDAFNLLDQCLDESSNYWESA